MRFTPTSAGLIIVLGFIASSPVLCPGADFVITATDLEGQDLSKSIGDTVSVQAFKTLRGTTPDAFLTRVDLRRGQSAIELKSLTRGLDSATNRYQFTFTISETDPVLTTTEDRAVVLVFLRNNVPTAALPFVIIGSEPQQMTVAVQEIPAVAPCARPVYRLWQPVYVGRGPIWACRNSPYQTWHWRH